MRLWSRGWRWLGSLLGGSALDDDASALVSGEELGRAAAEDGGEEIHAGVNGAEFVEEVFQ